MNTEEKNIAELLLRSLTAPLPESEQARLDAWLREDEAHRELYTGLLQDEGQLFQLLLQIRADEKMNVSDELYNRITSEIGINNAPRIEPLNGRGFQRRWWLAAACLLLVLAGGGFFWLKKEEKAPVPAIAQQTHDIAPGKEGALLTLSDGTVITLDSLGNGIIASQQGAAVVIRNGQLAYDPTGETGEETAYNTMRTPKGRQFNLLLPDSTRVWLNAASSIRFPTQFNGSERRVEITGEAYLEVAKNPSMPFRVKMNEQTDIEVLGTHFNIHAYNNENTLHTTLLEGSVQVGDQKLLPGQQARINTTNPGDVEILRDVDTDKVMAWKNGLFNFNGATLREVMRELERWYDIEVVYEPGVSNVTFGGKMTKGISLNGVLIALEMSDVHFRLEGRKLIVMP